MRKNIKKFAGIVLCIGMFTGCAQTPDSSLVKPKGSKAVDAYTEADDVSGSKGEASESKNDDGSESKTTIRNLIDAPQNYKSHVIRCADPVSVFFDTYRNILYQSDISGQDAQSASIPRMFFPVGWKRQPEEGGIGPGCCGGGVITTWAAGDGVIAAGSAV